jgi:glycosyltransferase involved in cell wall biosynthesis
MSRKYTKNPHSLSRKAYKATRSFLRYWKSPKQDVATVSRGNGLRVAFIHNEKKIATGAHHINQLMSLALAERGVTVRNFFPRQLLIDTPAHLKGIANILFFHSLLERRDEILKSHIIQGTTYTPLPFLSFNVPVVSHFGSTIRGYLNSTPRTAKLAPEEKEVYRTLFNLGIIPELDFRTFRPLYDIADIEELVAINASACIATSQKVQEELTDAGVPPEKVHVIHNAIEDYWFATTPPEKPQPPQLVFLGRLGGDVFTLKLKGLDRLVRFFNAFPDVPKTTVCITMNQKLKAWLRVSFPRHYMYTNLRKDLIPGALAPLYGSILFLPSRYEGFSLSLLEGMSQGLVPISYPVGVAPEVIRNGENGFIVTTQEEALARAKELLEDDTKRLTMAKAAQTSAGKFRSSRAANELLSLYQSIRRERHLDMGGSGARAETR